MKTTRLLVCFIGLLFFFQQAATATQIALVDEDVGHALLFNHQGNCYAVLPSHVARHDRFSLTGPLSTGSGSGEVFVRDVEGDIAIAVVEGQISQRCTGDFSALKRGLTDLLLQQPQAIMERLSTSGRIYDRTDAVIVENTDFHITVQTTNNLASGIVQQGSSGSILKANGIVLGIALQAPEQTRAIFLRMDVIARWLGAIFSGHFQPAQPAVAGARQDGSRAFRISGWQAGRGLSASSISSIEKGILNDPYVVPWELQPISIEITLSADTAIPFKHLRLLTDVRATKDHTAPKTVHMEVDVGNPQNPFWRSLGSRDVTAVGKLDFSTGGIFARRIRLTIQSVWQADKDLRIDGIVIE